MKEFLKITWAVILFACLEQMLVFRTWRPVREMCVDLLKIPNVQVRE